jgi:hypothetical protein
MAGGVGEVFTYEPRADKLKTKNLYSLTDVKKIL